MQTHSSKLIAIIGAPSDLGANIRGSNIGPSAIRIAGLDQKILSLGHKLTDLGDLSVPVREQLSTIEQKNKFKSSISQLCGDLAQKVEHALSKNLFPITIGGDHSIAIGSISGVSKFYKQQNKEIGLVWIDAHADINSPQSSPSGNIHGMPLQVLLGEGHSELVDIGFKGAKINPNKTVLIGIRNIDGEEKKLLKKSGIKYVTMREIDEKGMFKVMDESIKIASNETAGIHLSFDLDAIDPLYAPGVSTAETGGLSFREAHLALEMLADSQKLTSIDMVELNPITDIGHKTADLAVGLILSALGKSII